MKMYTTYYKSPLGPIKIVGNQDCILSLDFVEEELPGDADLPFCLKACVKQIDEYFKGNRRKFLLNLDPEGTKFQRMVWRQLEKIPFGEVVSYRADRRRHRQPQSMSGGGKCQREKSHFHHHSLPSGHWK